VVGGTAEDETQLKTKAHLITLISGVINRMIWFKFSKVYSPLGNSPRVKSRCVWGREYMMRFVRQQHWEQFNYHQFHIEGGPMKRSIVIVYFSYFPPCRDMFGKEEEDLKLTSFRGNFQVSQGCLQLTLTAKKREPLQVLQSGINLI
jgi:hypothetical protein